MSSTPRVDIAILGAGFAVSILAMALARQGRSVALIERGRHPRFAIGESSTPLADRALERIADRYDLPQLNSLATYGRWKASVPLLTCGAKRGFSYFYHQPHEFFTTDNRHSRELLVAANRDLDNADTHWLRSDVDTYLVQQARDMGVSYYDDTDLEPHYEMDEPVGYFSLSGTCSGRPLTLQSRFLIVATGSPVPNDWRLPPPNFGYGPRYFRTNTRAIFAHFTNVRPWRDILDEQRIDCADHPFDCDQSALHHVFPGGWMWQLRFDDGTTSAGFAIDNLDGSMPGAPTDAKGNNQAVKHLTPEEEWHYWLSRLPSVRRQFEQTSVVRPADGIRRVSRLQRACVPSKAKQSTPGRSVYAWAPLPAALGFADPLHSTGIAHTLFNVERLLEVLDVMDDPSALEDALQKYFRRLACEVDLLDRMISLAYRQTHDFEAFATATMPYFAAATSCELRAPTSLASPSSPDAFLLADDAKFLAALEAIESVANSTSNLDPCPTQTVADLLAPFNQVGLFTPKTPNMYRYTATK
ncbi:MAG: hypothetical protein KDA62_13790 [Planctomycetales bacterium]|nr:hypothetical protein [Planctomycetales bacterium]